MKIYEKCCDVKLELRSGSIPLFPLRFPSFSPFLHTTFSFSFSSSFPSLYPPLNPVTIFSSHTEVSDCSRITNLWLLGSMNSSPRFKKGRAVTVTTRAKSRRRREKTWPWRRAEVTGSSLTSVHWRPLPFSRWYCRVGPVLR